MAKHLTEREIEAIAELIRNWSKPKITWQAICDAVEPLIGRRITRQALNTHEEIVTAYHAVKKGVGKQVSNRPSSLKVASERIARLEREVARIKEENRLLRERFVIWQYNAYKHGLKEHQLNEPLPQIGRE